MKRTESALALVTLLSLAIAGAMLVNLAKANPMAYAWFPTEPVTTPPIITLQSPSQNQSYSETDIWLNFTVSKPETWFSRTELSEQYMPGTSMAVVRLISYHYILDGNESDNIPVEDSFYRVDPPDKPEETLNFSVNLTLTKGAHNITVIVESSSAYVIAEYRFSRDPTTIPVFGTSETVYFTVAQQSEPQQSEPFPTTWIAVSAIASMAVVGVGLLVYFKKRNH